MIRPVLALTAAWAGPMLIHEYFDRIYIINLPERKDRRSEMMHELAQAGIPAQSDRVEFFPAIRPDDAGGFPGIGARGCFMSHHAVLRRALADGLRRVLIMEDDLAIARSFPRDQERLIAQLRQTDWGFVYFGHIEGPPGPEPPELIPVSVPLVTAHFYGVNGPVLAPLTEFLDGLLGRPPGHPDGGPMHVDGAFSTFRARHPEIVTLLSRPNQGWQRSSRSDISTNRWFDRAPVFKQMAGCARSARNWWRAKR